MKSEKLKRLHVFSNLTQDELESINTHLTWHIYSKNSIVLNHHEYSDEVYFIAKGSVRATTYSLAGKEIAYQDLFEGDMFGELSAIDAGTRTTSIVTLESCELGRIAAEDFKIIIQTYPSVNSKVMYRLTTLVRFLCSRIYEFSVLDVKDRIRAEIIRHARQNKNETKYAVIDKMPTHEEIANRVSTHREAVTKEFSQLVKLGLIEKSGRKIIVPDIDKLTATLLEEI